MRPLIMGIVNVTPDSFSGDGLLCHEDWLPIAIAQGRQMVDDGAHLLDVGGESSRPGSVAVPGEEEIRRVVPVIRGLRSALPDTPIAIDTVKADVAAAAIGAGALIVNDISALAGDPRMAEVVASHGADIVLMDNRSSSGAVSFDAKIGGEFSAAAGEDILLAVLENLRQRADFAVRKGINPSRIWIDPGIGFGKSVEQHLYLINHLDRLKELGYPLLVGPSRKSFIGRVLDLPVDERVEGTAALVAVATLKGADMLRVHDVKTMSRVARMTRAVCDATGSGLSV